MLTFATKKLSTGANGQKEIFCPPLCPRSFDRAVMRRRAGRPRLRGRSQAHWQLSKSGKRLRLCGSPRRGREGKAANMLGQGAVTLGAG